MESDGTWLDLSRLGEIAAAVELAADSLLTRVQSGGSGEIGVIDAVRYREMVIFLLLAKVRLVPPAANHRLIDSAARLVRSS